MTNHISPEQLSAFVDGEAAAEETARISAHLAACPACRDQHAALLAVEQTLAQLRTPEPAPDLLWDLRRRLAAPAPRHYRWTWAAGLAALALAAVLCWPRGGTQVTRPPISDTHPAAAKREAVAVVTPAPSRVLAKESESVTGPVPRPSHPRPVLATHRDVKQRPAVSLSAAAHEPVAADSLAGADAGEGQGVILLLGEPEPVPVSSKCYLEVSRPDGTISVFSQTQVRDAAGQVQAARVSYRRIANRAER